MVDWEGPNKEVASKPDYIYYLAPFKGGFMACADTSLLTFKATSSLVECSQSLSVHDKIVNMSCAQNPESDLVFTCSRDPVIKLHSLDKRELIAELKGHEMSVMCIASNGANRLVSGSRD